MKRFEEWPRILTDFLRERQGVPFEWGQNDCLLFCADAIQAMTGEDLGADVRGTYTDEAGALEVIETFGESVEDILSQRLGEPKPISYAMRGDIVTLESGGRLCAGVVDETGRRAAVFVEGRGLARVKLADCHQAWTV